MTKKLFFVEATISGWVLAEDEQEADSFAYIIIETEDTYSTNVLEYSDSLLKSSGWDKDCYIYHKDQRTKDIKLGDVLKDELQ